MVMVSLFILYQVNISYEDSICYNNKAPWAISLQNHVLSTRGHPNAPPTLAQSEQLSYILDMHFMLINYPKIKFTTCNKTMIMELLVLF